MADDFTQELTAYLTSYTDDVEKALQGTFKSLKVEGVSRLKASALSVGIMKRKRDKFFKGFKGTLENGKLVLYNDDPVTHLLNNGHALRNGGRSRAYHFFEPVDEWIQDEAPKRVEEALNNL